MSITMRFSSRFCFASRYVKMHICLCYAYTVKLNALLHLLLWERTDSGHNIAVFCLFLNLYSEINAGCPALKTSLCHGNSVPAQCRLAQVTLETLEMALIGRYSMILFLICSWISLNWSSFYLRTFYVTSCISVQAAPPCLACEIEHSPKI